MTAPQSCALHTIAAHSMGRSGQVWQAVPHVKLCPELKRQLLQSTTACIQPHLAVLQSRWATGKRIAQPPIVFYMFTYLWTFPGPKSMQRIKFGPPNSHVSHWENCLNTPHYNLEKCKPSMYVKAVLALKFSLTAISSYALFIEAWVKRSMFVIWNWSKPMSKEQNKHH